MVDESAIDCRGARDGDKPRITRQIRVLVLSSQLKVNTVASINYGWPGTGPEHNEVGILLPLPVVSLFLERSPDKQETPRRCKFRGRVRTRRPAIRITGPEILAHFHGISCL